MNIVLYCKCTNKTHLIKNIILNHNDNYFKINDLYLNKKFLIKKIKSLDLKFKNADDHTNYFLLKKNPDYLKVSILSNLAFFLLY